MIELAGLPDDIPAFLLTEHGKPFASPKALGNKIRDWVAQAGLVDAEKKATRSQHGIRKRGAEEIAEATGSVFAVMAILSHSDIKTAQVYVDKVERARLAEKAAQEVAAARNRISVPRDTIRGTQSAKTAEKTYISKDEWQPVGIPHSHLRSSLSHIL